MIGYLLKNKIWCPLNISELSRWGELYQNPISLFSPWEFTNRNVTLSFDFLVQEYRWFTIMLFKNTWTTHMHTHTCIHAKKSLSAQSICSGCLFVLMGECRFSKIYRTIKISAKAHTTLHQASLLLFCFLAVMEVKLE